MIDKGKPGTCKGLVSQCPSISRRVEPFWQNNDVASLIAAKLVTQDLERPVRRSITTSEPTYTAADLMKAYEAYDTSNFNEALRVVAPMADADIVDAQILLADMFFHGTGVAKDSSRALIWFSKAANLGSADAQNAVGYLFAKGLGTGKDPKSAVRWFSVAAAAGNPIAKYNLGVAYAGGIGCEKDQQKAAELLSHTTSIGADGKDFVLPDAKLRGRYHAVPRELARTDRMVILPAGWRPDRYFAVTGYDTYADRLMERIRRRIRLDLEAPNAMVASFEISPDGSIRKLSVLRSTTDKAKDDLVITRIESAGPFRPLPVGSAGPVLVQLRVGGR